MRPFWEMKNIFLALLLNVSCFAQKRPITHEDIWLMKRTGEPVVSPDGRSVAVSVTEPDYDTAKQSSDLWLVAADGHQAPKQLTFTKALESGQVWSPDGMRLAFVTRREGDEVAQVYVLAMGGGEAQRITHVTDGASNPQWRPDGKAILFESAYDPLAAERKLHKWNARIYDAMPIRFWNAWLDEKKPHIFVQELGDSAKPVDVLKGSKLAESPGFAGLFNPGGGQSLNAVWTPDGQSILFAAYVNRTEMMSAETESRLFVTPASGGEPRALTGSGLQFSRPKFSPAGDRLYALAERKAKPGGRLYSLKRLAQFTWPSANQPTVLTEKWDRSVSAYSIAQDGKTVYLDAEDEGADQLFLISAQGGAVHRLFQVEHGGYANIEPVADGLIAVFQTAAQPPEIVRLDPAKRSHTMLTNFNAEKLREIDTPEPLQFWFTAKDGRRIHNILFLPPQFDKNKRYPLVVFPHGGPASMSKDAFSTRWNSYLLTSPGYVLIETNYKGSTGFGEKFADDIERDVLRGPAEEILEAIEEASQKYPFIDKSRQAAVGASYGGYLMNWFNGHTRQFKCLVIHAGAINNEAQYGTNDGGLDRELRMGVPIWEKGGQWNGQSPIRYSGSFQTPSLITDGEQDFRVPLSESITTFKILQRRGVPSRLVVFPEEGHWILKGENSRLHMQEVLAWLNRYL
jgi:dipeptidyl aminopeptidase/acylaminoacyl peptidase